jgi:NAD+ synthase
MTTTRDYSGAGRKPIDVEAEIRRSRLFEGLSSEIPFINHWSSASAVADSTLTGKLCQLAINELRAETGDSSLQFIAVRLPYGVQADEQDCQDAIALFSRIAY